MAKGIKQGFVGNGSDKFTEKGERRARNLIRKLLLEVPTIAMVSGHSPVGGIDIWAEEEADDLGIALELKIPEVNQWNPPGKYGFKARNLDIAKCSQRLNVILADEYPDEYDGRVFKSCYHHSPPATDHVKSGGCWTGKMAERRGKEVFWYIIKNY